MSPVIAISLFGGGISSIQKHCPKCKSSEHHIPDRILDIWKLKINMAKIVEDTEINNCWGYKDKINNFSTIFS